MEEYDGKEPEELFWNIFQKSRKLRVSAADISKLDSFRKLTRPRKTHWWNKTWFRLLSMLLLFSSVIVPYGSQSAVRLLVQFWLSRDRFYDEMCIVRMPSQVQNLFMPPVDCSMCRNLNEVERVTNITPREFEERFAYTGVPVIVKDGTKNWTAPAVFNFEFFKRLYLKENFHQVEKECQFFPYKTEFLSLYEALSMPSKRASQPWYIGWSNCDSEVGNTLRKHYQRPYFLPLQSESANIDWIFMGTPGYGAHMHIDHVINPSWQAQIRGSKLWMLEPVPECYHECKPVEVLVNAGEVIVLDTNRWYHKTLTVGKHLSITIGSEYD